jgi:hypothetical protein
MLIKIISKYSFFSNGKLYFCHYINRKNLLFFIIYKLKLLPSKKVEKNLLIKVMKKHIEKYVLAIVVVLLLSLPGTHSQECKDG